jgi:antitoxin CptB
MGFNIEQLKKKIIYRSNYRGTKEMDKLLGAFTNKIINQLNNIDLIALEKFLDIDDDNLYKFYNGLKTDFIFEDSVINNLFKNFKYKKNEN